MIYLCVFVCMYKLSEGKSSSIKWLSQPFFDLKKWQFCMVQKNRVGYFFFSLFLAAPCAHAESYFPDQRPNPCPLQCKCRVLTTRPLGKSNSSWLFLSSETAWDFSQHSYISFTLWCKNFMNCISNQKQTFKTVVKWNLRGSPYPSPSLGSHYVPILLGYISVFLGTRAKGLPRHTSAPSYTLSSLLQSLFFCLISYICRLLTFYGFSPS